MTRKMLVVLAMVMAASALASVTAGAASQDDLGGNAAGEVDWVAAHFGLSRAGAVQRLAVEDAAGRLDAALRSKYRDTFAGLWLNTSGPVTTVTVAFTTDVNARLDELRREFAYPETLVGAQRERSLADLQDGVASIAEDRTRMQSTHSERAPADAVEATGGRFDIAGDPVRGTIAVVTPHPSPELEEALFRRYGERIEVRQGLSDEWCSRENCTPTMRGGLHLRWDGGADGCTSAFPVYNGATRYVLSAAHCGGGLNRYNGGWFYGYVDAEVYAGPVDAERIRRTGGYPWTESNSIYLGDEPYRAITGFTPYTQISHGMTLAFSARSSASTYRGSVQNTLYSPADVPAGQLFIVMDGPCGAPGDSGAPIFRNNSAVGILHGPGNPYGCTSFGAVEFALDALLVQLVTG